MSTTTLQKVIESSNISTIDMSKAPSLRIASDSTRTKQGEKVSDLVTDILVKGSGYTKAIEATAKEMRVFRLMFPASAAVQALLGENAPDLIGGTPAYRAAWKVVTDKAIEQAAAQLVEEGASEKAALAMARDEAETFRKSVSRRFRIMMETEAKKLGTGPGARFLLAHGFERNGELGNDQLLTKGAKLVAPAGLPEGESFTAQNAVVQLPTIAPKAINEAGNGDAVPPTETASALITALEAKLAEEMGATPGEEGSGPLTNPAELLNLAVGMLNDAARLIPEAKLTKRQREASLSALMGAVNAVVEVLK